MAGSYCKFCGHRCFVLRLVPDGPHKGWSGHMATCRAGMEHDLKALGHTHVTAINPVTEPEAAAMVHGWDWEQRPGFQACARPREHLRHPGGCSVYCANPSHHEEQPA
jgi:hypothetical protein